MPFPSPQDDFLQDYEEEVARVLENMGTCCEGRDVSRNFKVKNYAPNQLAPVGNSGHAKLFHLLIIWRVKGNQFLLWMSPF